MSPPAFIALAQTDSSRCPSSLIFFVVNFAWVAAAAPFDAGQKRQSKNGNKKFNCVRFFQIWSLVQNVCRRGEHILSENPCKIIH